MLERHVRRVPGRRRDAAGRPGDRAGRRARQRQADAGDPDGAQRRRRDRPHPQRQGAIPPPVPIVAEPGRRDRWCTTTTRACWRTRCTCTTCPQLVIAKDGIPLAQPYWADTINVAPGERYSVLVMPTAERHRRVGLALPHPQPRRERQRPLRHGHRPHRERPEQAVTARPETTIEVFADIACPFTHVGLTRFVQHRDRAGRSESPPEASSLAPGARRTGSPRPAGGGGEGGATCVPRRSSDLRGFDPPAFPASTLPALRLVASGYRQSSAVGERVSLHLRALLFDHGVDITDPALPRRGRRVRAAGVRPATDTVLHRSGGRSAARRHRFPALLHPGRRLVLPIARHRPRTADGRVAASLQHGPLRGAYGHLPGLSTRARRRVESGRVTDSARIDEETRWAGASRRRNSTASVTMRGTKPTEVPLPTGHPCRRDEELLPRPGVDLHRIVVGVTPLPTGARRCPPHRAVRGEFHGWSSVRRCRQRALRDVRCRAIGDSTSSTMAGRPTKDLRP